MPPESQTKNWKPFIGAACILFVTLVTYLPVFHAGFIWDDDSMLTGNAFVKARNGLRYIWFSTGLPDYFPLTSTSLWLEWQLWGDNPRGYHIVNLLLHSVSSVILWRIFIKLKFPGAWLAAALFAVHPVNVESVAWIAERKNTLCFFFYALAFFYYLCFETEPVDSNPRKRRWYFLSLVAFVCALLSKTSVVMMPFVLLLLAIWWRGKIQKSDLLRSVPFFAASLVFGLITIWFQYNRAIAGDPVPDKDFVAKVAGAVWALGFYLSKALFPFNLSFVYPEFRFGGPSFAAWLPWLVLIGLGFLLWRFRGRARLSLFFAFGYFVLMLLPILGFLKIYFQRYSPVADHWQYFALPAVTAAVSAGLFWLFNNGKNHPVVGSAAASAAVRRALAPNLGAGMPTTKASSPTREAPALPIPFMFVAALLLIACVFLTWKQAAIYRTAHSLWIDTLQKNPQAWLAHNNLGLSLEKQGRQSEAMDHYQKSLAIQPQQVEAYNNLGSAFLDNGNLERALAEYQTAFQINSNSAVTLYNLGNVYDRQNRREDARSFYLKAIEINPQYLDAHNNLACLLAMEGNYNDAMSHFQEVLKLDPDYINALNNLGSTLIEIGKPGDAIPFLERAVLLQPLYADAEYNLGNALFALQKIPQAVPHYSRALQINPQMPMAHYKLGNALLQSGRGSEAFQHYSMAVQLQPDLAEAHYQLAVLFSADKRMAKAIHHYKEAIRLKPDWVEPLNNLAWIFATHPDSDYRDSGEAIRLAEKVSSLTEKKDPATLDTMGAAYASDGQFKKAEAIMMEALALSEKSGDQALTTALKKRLEVYRNKKPWREEE